MLVNFSIRKVAFLTFLLATLALIGCSDGGGGGTTISATADITAQNLSVGVAMTSFSPLTPSGGTTPYTYSVSSGTLPAGLNLNTSTGAVTGTPTVTYAAANVVFSVKDANNVVANTTSTVRFTAVIPGIITTVAGNGGNGYVGDSVAATSTALNLPFGVAVDSSDNLYIADYLNNRIRIVAKTTGTYFGTPMVAGNIYTVAGNGNAGYLGDGALATSGELNAPLGVAIDGSGNLYIADENNHEIRVVAKTTGTFFGVSMTAGNIYTVAGNGTNGYSGDAGLATSAMLSNPSGLAFDSSGNLYIGDQGNNRIRVVAKTTGTFFGVSMTAGNIDTVAGNVTGGGFAGDGAAASLATLSHPYAIAFDSSGNLYFADAGNNRIRVVANTTGTYFGAAMTAGDIYTVAGIGPANSPGAYSGDAGPAASAALNSPNGLAFDSAGNLYIGDQMNNSVRAIAKTTGTYFGVPMVAGNIYTVAGNGTAGFAGDGAVATSAQMATPSGLAIDSAGILYIGDAGNERVRAVTP